jgi:hypothetical protein
VRTLTHYEQTWPHPKHRPADPVDPRLVAVVRRTLLTQLDMADDVDEIAAKVADRVWAWLAEGD